jgi:hypothetical protein
VSGTALSDFEKELTVNIGAFENDPYGYVMYAFPWGTEGTELANESGPREWQVETLIRIGEALEEGGELGAVVREAIASGHGVGKSALVSWLILWAMSTREHTKGMATANTEAQLRTKTWPELSKWYRNCVNRHWFVLTATAMYSADPECEKTWRFDAIAWSKNNTEAFAGMHNKGRRILVLFDEASAIPDVIFEVTEGALTDKDTQIIWCAFGNPTRNTGMFRECFRKFRHRWVCHQIDSREVPGTNADLMATWVKDYGEDSDFVKVRVRGVFPSQSIAQFISEDLVLPARGKHLQPDKYSFAPKILTCDPAWEGDDALVIGMRQGLKFEILYKIPKNDNDIMIATRLAALEDQHKADAVFVDGGYGTGIVSAGRTMGRSWQIVWFSEKPSDDGYLNKRAEMWGLMKQWLGEGGAIPNDDDLFYDLIGPETVPRMDGKIQLESKEAMKRRGLISPNCGDALALSFARPVVAKVQTLPGRANHSKVVNNWKPF